LTNSLLQVEIQSILLVCSDLFDDVGVSRGVFALLQEPTDGDGNDHLNDDQYLDDRNHKEVFDSFEAGDREHNDELNEHRLESE